MIPYVVTTFNEIVYKACERFGKEEGVEAKEMQVLFKLDSNRPHGNVYRNGRK